MANDLSQDERAELEALRIERVKSGKGGLYLKVSTKGGISLYGLQKFPVTLYKEQWEKVVAHAGVIQQFISDHAEELKSKGNS